MNLTLLTPRLYVRHLSDISAAELVSRGLRFVLLDIDNTLETYQTVYPSPETLSFVHSLQDAGLGVCIVSNGKAPRSAVFAQAFGNVPFLYRVKKPMKQGFLQAMGLLGARAEETCMIGDQIFTDVLGANRCKITSILVEPVDRTVDEIMTVWKRPLEKKIVGRLVAGRWNT